MSETDFSYALLLEEIAKGGIVTKPAMAEGIAALVIANAYGEDELRRQEPLEVSDQEDRWLVEGSYNRARKPEDVGPVRIWILKRDGRILDLALPRILEVPPEVKEIVRKARRDGEGSDRG